MKSKVEDLISWVVVKDLTFMSNHKVFRPVFAAIISGIHIHLDGGDVYGFTRLECDVNATRRCPVCGEEETSFSINLHAYVIGNGKKPGVALSAMYRCDTVTVVFDDGIRAYAMQGDTCKAIERINKEDGEDVI